MFESIGRFSCAFRRATISFSMFFYLLSINHRFIPFCSIFVSWINTPLSRQPRTFLSHSLNLLLFQWMYYSYIGAEFPKVLEKLEVEYRQVNITVPCTLREWTILRNTFILSFSEHLSDVWAAGGSFQFWLCLRLHWRNSIWSDGNGNDCLQLDIPLTILSRFKLTLPSVSHDCWDWRLPNARSRPMSEYSTLFSTRPVTKMILNQLDPWAHGGMSLCVYWPPLKSKALLLHPFCL